MKTVLPISTLVPTRDRAGALKRMLDSLSEQSAQPAEMIVVDASTGDETRRLCGTSVPGLSTKLIHHEANEVGAAAQRNQAMLHATQEWVLFLDDDIIFDPDCILRLWKAIQGNPNLGGVNAMIVNQKYSPPGRVSRVLFRYLHGRPEASYAGKCIGPALNLLPEDRPDLPDVVSVEWLNLGCTLYRREALPYPLFPAHFRGYSFMEDVSLSLFVAEKWRLANVRKARIFHESRPADYKSDIASLAKMELVNRHFIMTRILSRKQPGDYIRLIALEAFGIATSLTSLNRFAALPKVLSGKLSAVRVIAAEQFGRRT
ncbi:MAG TPA: glycosyltransferase [Nitrospiria bacterium]|nr:glycosyltransferase [Nitrospiria bacterium]